MVAQFPSGSNTFVPDHNASNKMVVDFSRNPKDFPLNRYAQIVPTKKTTGYYMNMTVEEAGRIINSDLAEFAWPDGADAPEDVDGTESFEFLDFRCERYKYGFRLGYLAREQADWEINEQHLRIKGQQAMTARTQRAVTIVTNTANYDSSHYSAVASISGNTGNFAASTTARQDIKRSLNYGANVILKDTLSAVKPEDFVVVLNPTAAAAISQTQEIVDHVKGSPDAWAQVRGELPGRNVLFGLPDRLYGFEVVIENTAKVTSRKGATRALSYVWPDATIALLSRPGGLEGVAGAPSFSTLSLFVYEKDDMTVETKDDPENRVTRGRVVDNFVPKVTAPVGGFIFTSAV